MRPIAESCEFLALKTVFLLRDVYSKVGQRVLWLLCRFISLLCALCRLIDPNFEKRWGTKTELQAYMCTMQPFPPNSRVRAHQVHTPAPRSEVWNRAFESTPERLSSRLATCLSTNSPFTSPYNSRPASEMGAFGAPFKAPFKAPFEAPFSVFAEVEDLPNISTMSIPTLPEIDPVPLVENKQHNIFKKWKNRPKDKHPADPEIHSPKRRMLDIFKKKQLEGM